jgi:DNA (cytosine-5)-methyltransferase 1
MVHGGASTVRRPPLVSGSRHEPPTLPPTPRRSTHEQRLTSVELFCGAGGMALGFEQAGFDVLAAIDLDPVHLAVHERNFPLCEPLCADITETAACEILAAAERGWELRYPEVAFRGEVDCLFGGPSCQGFSVIGPRDREDPRNALIAEFARLVAELRPRWFAMENVPGLLSPGYRSVLDAFCESLRNAGYEVAAPWRLDARDHGVPQVRKRVFVLGARKGERLPRQPPAQAHRPTVGEALADLPQLARFRSLRGRDDLMLSEGDLSAMRERQSGYVRRLNGNDRDKDDLSDGRTWDQRVLSSVGLAAHSDDVVARFKRLRRGERDIVGRLPRLDERGQSPTLRAGTGRDHGSFTSARPVHYSSPRVISVREAARLHGFPDWFGFHATKWHGFRQVGNAVPPPLARAVARTVVRAAGRSPGKRVGEPLALGDASLLSMTMLEAGARYGRDPGALPPNVRAITAALAKQAA